MFSEIISNITYETIHMWSIQIHIFGFCFYGKDNMLLLIGTFFPNFILYSYVLFLYIFSFFFLKQAL